MHRASTTLSPAGHPPPRRAHGPARRLRAFGALAVLLLAPCLILPPTAGAAPDVTVTKAWFRYLLPGLPAGGYMTLSNHSSEAIVLEGASSPACGSLMLHRSEEKSGVERMVPAGKITVPPHGIFRLAPGGYHLMCMHPLMHIGKPVTVTLDFADGSRIAMSFAVYGVSGPTGSAPNGDATMKMPM